MGSGKIEIKRIENSSNRQVTYSKRKDGILKKAKEISVLCDAQVSLIVFDASGKMDDYISPSTTLIDILDRYQKTSGKTLWDAKHENLSNEIDKLKKENDNMQTEFRRRISLNYKELIAIEDALENGLSCVRDKQMEVHGMHRRNGKILEEEHWELSFMPVSATAFGCGRCQVRDVENGFEQSIGELNSQMPFAFRVQPMQPNLHERM